MRAQGRCVPTLTWLLAAVCGVVSGVAVGKLLQSPCFAVGSLLYVNLWGIDLLYRLLGVSPGMPLPEWKAVVAGSVVSSAPPMVSALLVHRTVLALLWSPSRRSRRRKELATG